MKTNRNAYQRHNKRKSRSKPRSMCNRTLNLEQLDGRLLMAADVFISPIQAPEVTSQVDTPAETASPTSTENARSERRGNKPEMVCRLQQIIQSEPEGKWDHFDWESAIDDDKIYNYVDPVVGGSLESTGKSIKDLLTALPNSRNDILRLLQDADGIPVFSATQPDCNIKSPDEIQEPTDIGSVSEQANTDDSTVPGSEIVERHIPDQIELEHKAVQKPVLGPVLHGGSISSHDNSLDVNKDGIIDKVDALQVLNKLNEHGGHSALDQSLIAPPAILPGGCVVRSLFDVNWDGVVSNRDVLTIVNHLNKHAQSEPDNQTDLAEALAEVRELGSNLQFLSDTFGSSELCPDSLRPLVNTEMVNPISAEQAPTTMQTMAQPSVGTLQETPSERSLRSHDTALTELLDEENQSFESLFDLAATDTQKEL